MLRRHWKFFTLLAVLMLVLGAVAVEIHRIFEDRADRYKRMSDKRLEASLQLLEILGDYGDHNPAGALELLIKSAD